jgi:hypothetical protein
MGRKRNSRPPPVPRARRRPKRLFRLERSVSLPPPTRRHGAAGACPVGLCPLERHPGQSPDEVGIAGRRPGGRSPPDGSPDATRPAGSAEAAVQADHGQPSRLAGRANSARSGLRSNRARQEVGHRHLLRVDPKAGCISPSLSTGLHAGSLAGQQTTGCIATWLLPPCAKP